VSIKKPSAVDSPYVTTSTTPTVLNSAPGVQKAIQTTVQTGAQTAASQATIDATVAVANRSYYANGQAAIDSLITTSRTGVFAGANVALGLTEQNYITYNQNYTGNGTVGGANGQIQFNNNGSFAGSTNLTFDGANLVVGGNITGNYILGNGSQLTGINASSNKIFNGTSYANIANASGNLVISANGSPWTFGTDGSTIFPTLTTQRGDNPSGTISGQTLLFGDANQEAIISTPDGTPGNEYSQRLVINPGAGNDFGEGGDIYIWAGRGGDGSGSGGDIKIRGGQGGANTLGGSGGDGGYIRIEAGNGANEGNPGYIEMTAGEGGIGKSGGYVNITGGLGNTTGGDVQITGGRGRSSVGGNVNIWGGSSDQGPLSEGNVNIETGGNTWAFDATGTLTVPGDIVAEEDNDLNFEVYNTTTGGGTGLSFVNYDSNVGQKTTQLVIGSSNAELTTNFNHPTGSKNTWVFAQDGSLTVPDSIIGPSDAFFNIKVTDSGPGASLQLGDWDITGVPKSLVQISDNVHIVTGVTTGGGDWNFDTTGNLTLPAGGNILDSNNKPVIKIELPFSIKTADFNAVAGGRYGVDTTSVAVTATLPASPATGDAVFFADASGTTSTNNFIIARNGGTIMGSASNMTVNVNDQSFGLFYNGTTWRVY